MYQLEYNTALLYHPDRLSEGSVDDKELEPTSEAVGRMTVTAWPGRTAGETEAALLKQLNREKVDDIKSSPTADPPGDNDHPSL